ncbi:MAG: malate dehydrogenase, partial [Candidatus Bathyarchaeia archaeon]
YGYRGVFAEVPIVLGKNGVEKIIEVDLNSEQKEKLAKSIEAIKNNLKQVPESFLH